MKFLIVLVALVAVAVAAPQREGQQFTPEAIRQAQDSYLIPRDAQIQNVCGLVIDCRVRDGSEFI